MQQSDDAAITRINELSRIGRSVWITLLAYLAFIFLAMLGMQQSDLVVDSRRIDLPIIGIAVQTKYFLIFAPIGAASLYVYLHQYLIKLWDAVSEAPATIGGKPLSDNVDPWLVTELAANLRGGAATRKRALGWLTRFVTRLLVWYAGIFVLAVFLFQSLPLHDPFVSAVCLLCLMITVFAGLCSSGSARAVLTGKYSLFRKLLHWTVGAGTLAILLLLSVSDYLPDETGADLSTGETDDTFNQRVLRTFALNLSGQELVALPATWRSHATARKDFRVKWCAREAIPMDACDHMPELNRSTPDFVYEKRTAWCAANGVTETGCDDLFVAYDTRFIDDWKEERTSSIDALPHPVLSNKDLRQADAWGAVLIGTEFRNTRLSDAEFNFANLEGAYFEGADLIGADLSNAQMQLADLSYIDLSDATLSSTDLGFANLDSAVLIGAQMPDANLNYASLVEAKLSGVDLKTATLFRADLSQAVLEAAKLNDVNLNGANLTGANLGQAHLNGAIMHFSDLGRAKLEGTTLTGATISAANFEDANLRNTFFASASTAVSDFTNADLSGADMQSASLLGNLMDGTNFSGAILADATLFATSLSGARLDGTDLENAGMEAVQAHGADLRGARNLTQEQLDVITGNAATLLPTGASEIGIPLHVQSCWAEEPETYEFLSSAISDFNPDLYSVTADELYAALDCAALGAEYQITGTPCATDLTQDQCLDPTSNPHHPANHPGWPFPE